MLRRATAGRAMCVAIAMLVLLGAGIRGAAVGKFGPVPMDSPPVADAGPDQTVNEGATVQFDGAGSTDDTGIVNYTWTVPGNPGVVRTLFNLSVPGIPVFDPVRPTCTS